MNLARCSMSPDELRPYTRMPAMLTTYAYTSTTYGQMLYHKVGHVYHMRPRVYHVGVHVYRKPRVYLPQTPACLPRAKVDERGTKRDALLLLLLGPDGVPRVPASSSSTGTTLTSRPSLFCGRSKGSGGMAHGRMRQFLQCVCNTFIRVPA
ncbi:unnamed protein product [Lota lota]